MIDRDMLILSVLVVLALAAAFMVQRNDRKQREWREKKQLEVDTRRAKLARKAKEQSQEKE